MSFLDSIILGIVQGLTEFFPVSSSAHLKIAKILLNIADGEHLVLFDLFCHMGTLLACFFFLFHKIYEILLVDRKKILYLSLAILPLCPMYFFLKPLRVYLSNIHFLGFFLILSGFFLLITALYKPKEKNSPYKIKDMLFIGIMQAMALIPGISRSGSTISAACWRGWKVNEAITFSFLLAIPTVMGGSVLESYKSILSQSTSNVSFSCYLAGFVTSFVVGSFAIRYIFSIVDRKKIKPFAFYCIAIGLITLIWLK